MRISPRVSLYVITAVISTAVVTYILTVNHVRRSMIRERGSQVMPFTLDATRHVFRKTDDGGIQQVVVINPKDAEQIEMIRSHLKMEARKFGKGDYSDPSI